jgi:hypothetical protein
MHNIFINKYLLLIALLHVSMFVHHPPGISYDVGQSYKLIKCKQLYMWLLQLINRSKTPKQNVSVCAQFSQCLHVTALHNMPSCKWWLHIQSIVSGTVFTVGPTPVCGAFCVSRSTGRVFLWDKSAGAWRWFCIMIKLKLSADWLPCPNTEIHRRTMTLYKCSAP